MSLNLENISVKMTDELDKAVVLIWHKWVCHATQGIVDAPPFRTSNE